MKYDFACTHCSIPGHIKTKCPNPGCDLPRSFGWSGRVPLSQRDRKRRQERIRELFKEGQHAVEICREVGVNMEYVRRALRRAPRLS